MGPYETMLADQPHWCEGNKVRRGRGLGAKKGKTPIKKRRKKNPTGGGPNQRCGKKGQDQLAGGQTKLLAT